MYVTDLSGGHENHSTFMKHPTWEDIKNAILDLDGLGYNLVIFGKEYDRPDRRGDIEEFMAIAGGGKNNFYICKYYSYEEGEDIFLYDPSKSLTEEIEIVDVFPGLFPLAVCFNIDPILRAAQTYALFGHRDTSLDWGYFSINQPSQLEIIRV
ncbi:hypothetical protein [Roseofilum sp. Guam]|uniref:hypothetical protein n=1 Tax=Roseofilum sp. Guam TaxID=2821502 RepID=UPI001B2E804B|nr:hypothetical protein [Roseofilum sp. Guam]MBP0030238.1 hypothetical protein [Roseofilum sp. Guam]